MRIYLAGPMRGKHLHNFPAFMKAAMWLRDEGHFVHNPAEKDMSIGFNPMLPCDHEKNLEVFSLKEAFEWDFKAIMDSAAIVLLPGWRDSKGAQAEVILAIAMQRHIYEYADDMLQVMTDSTYDVSFDE